LLGCWFIVERERERASSSWRGIHFCRARECIPRLLSNTEIKATRTTLNACHIVRIEQAVQQARNAQKLRQGIVQAERSYCTYFFNSIQQEKGHGNQGRKYSPYCTYSIQSVRSVRLLFRHINRGEGAVLFFGSFCTFPKANVQHLLHYFGMI
jgi:hypothetical protein